MLSGFNTNYRHQGVLFHVQTEDSGRDNPHVITHLFYGGNIIASVKRDYSQRVGGDDLEATVRSLMERQHKEMLKQLSRGEHNTAILQRLGPDIFKSQSESTASELASMPGDQSTASEHIGPETPAPAPVQADAAPPAEPDRTRPVPRRAASAGIVPGAAWISRARR